MRTRTTVIDGSALRRLIKAQDISLSKASMMLGYDATYLSKVCRDNKIAIPAMKSIKMYFDIEEDAYKKKPVEKVEPQTVEVVQSVGFTDDDARKLYQIIYSATYEAMKKALND